jgi:hypothetical protein
MIAAGPRMITPLLLQSVPFQIKKLCPIFPPQKTGFSRVILMRSFQSS